jgi:hypothetical protein
MTPFSQTQTSSIERLLSLLDQFPDCCDPDFDNDAEELERQFAELRLTFNPN